MSRFLGVTVLGLACATLVVPGVLQAQHRGGGGGGAIVRGSVGGTSRPAAGPTFTARPVPAGQPNPVVNPGRSFVGSPVVGSSGFRAPHVPIVRSPRTVIVSPGFGYSPFGYYPGAYAPYYSPFSPYDFYSQPGVTAPGYSYSEPAYVPSYGQEAPVPSQNDSELSYQIGRLSAEIEQLKQQQAQSLRPPAPPSQPTPTALIFKDGHRQEIQNYAIVGQTLWVLDERNSSKIPLADLDLDATQKENRARGLRFVPPSAR